MDPALDALETLWSSQTHGAYVRRLTGMTANECVRLEADLETLHWNKIIEAVLAARGDPEKEPWIARLARMRSPFDFSELDADPSGESEEGDASPHASPATPPPTPHPDSS
jgi:hypothetical protein